jgi:DNA-binding MarR family transcriptional regulator
MNLDFQISTVLDRLSRVQAALRRAEGLTDAQVAVLGYLAQANRFSRSPSAVADYLATTRGTASQTLKSLAEKGLMQEHALPEDKRLRRYDLTETGQQLANRFAATQPYGPPDQAANLLAALRSVLRTSLTALGGRSFGLCRSCAHHHSQDGSPYCALLALPLAPHEAEQLCQDHAELERW